MVAAQLSARAAPEGGKVAGIPDLLVSADSHVDEPVTLWDSLSRDLREKLPELKAWTPETRAEGGLNPAIRIQHMDLDQVAAEVLYPTTVLRAFAAPHEAQAPAFRLYNDWLADYCGTAPKRLFGVPALCVYDIDEAVAELRRCNDMGLKGGLIWQVPDPRLPFDSDHYERLWAAAAEIGLPINLHILSGHSYNRFMGQLKGKEAVRGSVNIKTADAVTTVFDLIWSGVFERHPTLKLEMVESEIGWIPFTLQQWDYYYRRFIKPGNPNFQKFEISRPPSEIFADHFYATFMDDLVGTRALNDWGDHNCMWSSDYPHGNMTWPSSRAFIARQIGKLDMQKQVRLVSQNVIDLYKLVL